MAEPTAQRTLVKSPPELWAEVSHPESLARHLGGFGDEIRITRVEPETVVTWEGDRARGTVQIEPSGWGTKVTVTAEVETPPEPEPEPEPVAEPGAHAAEGGGSAEPEPVVEPPEPEPEPVAEAPPAQSATYMLERAGFFARMFGRQRLTGEMPDTPREPEPEIPAPTPVPEPDPEPVEEPDLPEPTPLPERDPDPMPPAAAVAEPAEVEELLSGVLDSLGSAHHRPFSRQ